MGMSMVLSLRGKLRSGEHKILVFFKGASRSVKLFVLGYLLNMYNNNNVPNSRSFGVLQRLGYAYLIVFSQEAAWMKAHPTVQVRCCCKVTLRKFYIIIKKQLSLIRLDRVDNGSNHTGNLEQT